MLIRRALLPGFLLPLFLILSTPAHSTESDDKPGGWSFHIDNDLFAQGDRDNDYTAGMAFKTDSKAAKTWQLSLDGWLASINELIAFHPDDRPGEGVRSHSMALGFALFTPLDLTVSTPIADQHPYASLVFVNNSRTGVNAANTIAYQSSLTIGLVGLPIASDTHEALHSFFDATEPQGWDNQISSGGEITFRYAMTRSRHLDLVDAPLKNLQIKASLHASLGFATDLGLSLSMRWGEISSAWWSFTPEDAEYIDFGSFGTVMHKPERRESYVWLGVSLKQRFYNVFLQGQWESSAVTFDRDQLQDQIAEIWLGYTHEFESAWQIRAFIRARSREIDLAALPNPVWGGIVIARSY